MNEKEKMQEHKYEEGKLGKTESGDNRQNGAEAGCPIVVFVPPEDKKD